MVKDANAALQKQFADVLAEVKGRTTLKASSPEQVRKAYIRMLRSRVGPGQACFFDSLKVRAMPRMGTGLDCFFDEDLSRQLGQGATGKLRLGPLSQHLWRGAARGSSYGS